MLITMAAMASNNYISSGSNTLQYNARSVVQLSSLHSNENAKAKAAKRRSAVERLEASKANYVKSEKVLDAKQELRHSNHLRITNTTPSIEVLKNTWKLWTQPSSPHIRTIQQNGGNAINGHHPPRSNRPPTHTLPPKSPGLGRAKSKPDCRTHSVKKKEDFQFKLRKLISSRDNSTDSEYSHQSPKCPVIQPRAQQDGNYSLHKSMPDLNKVNPSAERSDCAHSATNSSSCENNKQTLNVSYRATSDYVSRSPSCKQEYEDSWNGKEGNVGQPTRTSVQVDNQFQPRLDSISKRKLILRSKSDVSYRYSKEPYADVVKRPPKYGPELERFFDSMGLDVTELSNLGTSDILSPSQFFDSISSIDSDARLESIADGDDDISDSHTCSRSGLRNSDLVGKNGPTETSIIERNARIIKWLYNCRRSVGQS